MKNTKNLINKKIKNTKITKNKVQSKSRVKSMHMLMYNKEFNEVKYFDKCPICNSRIDELGYCACDAHL